MYAPSDTAAFKLMPWPWRRSTDLDGIRAVMGPQFWVAIWRAIQNKTANSYVIEIMM
jgi:hypothetical protein